MADRILSCADIFSGAGGFSLAAQNCGMQVRLAVESNAHAAATYRQNFSTHETRHKLVEDDIRSVDFNALAQDLFEKNGGCDLLLGGPPCQGYSKHRINNTGVGDERNDLIHAYFDCVESLKPMAFIMENVPGMLWPRHKNYVDDFYARGEKAGYILHDPVVLDARDFGVPQRRKRVFILGFKNGINLSSLVWPPAPTHSNDSDSRDNLLSWLSCAAAFKGAPENDPNNIHMNHGEDLVQAFKSTPKNGGSRHQSGRVLNCHKGHDGHKDVYGRINPGAPAPTMTTACINPSKGRFVHPTRHHGITVRQAARIQTFPDSFIFAGGLTAAGRQVGNAVPVLLGMSILNALKPVLEWEKSGRNQHSKKRSVPE